MCHKIQNYSRNLDLNDVMNSVKCLSYLGVSVNSNIMQMLLQLISKMINDMSLQQITFLHFLLKELSSCPLVDALKLALPIVFETQVQYKLEDNLYWQVEFLNYIAKHRLSQETYDFVMARIIKNIDQISPKIVQSLLLCLYYKNYSTEKYIDTINRCLQYYTNHLEYIADISDVEAIVSRMINKYSTDSELFYNEQFINTIMEFMIKNEQSFENLAFIVKKLNRIVRQINFIIK
jgi:FAST kinase domain-containing protein 2